VILRSNTEVEVGLFTSQLWIKKNRKKEHPIPVVFFKNFFIDLKLKHLLRWLNKLNQLTIQHST